MVRLIAVLVLATYCQLHAQTNTSGAWVYEINNGTATIIENTATDLPVSLTIPSSIDGLNVTGIESRKYLVPLFRATNMNQVTNLVIPNTVTNVGYFSFTHFSGLRNVVLPESVTRIGGSAFKFCTSLTNIVFPSGLLSIGDTNDEGYGAYVFDSSGLKQVTIPNSVTTIGISAFYSCNNLTNIVVGSSVSVLGGWAFEGCEKISEITFLGNAPTYGGNPFLGTPSFTLYYTQGTYGWGSTFAGRQTTLSGNFILTLAYDPAKGAVTNVPSGNSFSPEASISVSAIPVAGYAFTAWSGDATSTNNPLVLVMNTNKAVTANFGPDNGDTDGDGLSNYQEVIVFNTNPNQAEINSPVAGLYLASQKQAERAAGQNDVINNPINYGLYTTTQIQVGMFDGVFLSRSNNQFVLNYHILQSSDLQKWTPSHTNSVVIPVQNTNKMFFQLMPVMTSSNASVPPPP